MTDIVAPQDLVLAIVPKSFSILQDQGGTRLDIKAGTQELPRFIAEHWYAKANGVTVYEQKAAVVAPAPEADPIKATDGTADEDVIAKRRGRPPADKAAQ